MPKTTEELYRELIEKGNAAQQQANDLLSQYDNRPAFSYDARNDPLYQSYKDQFVHQGKRAMEDTMGQAAGLTGGYGNTYAQSVGNQAYNEYLTKLNAEIPALAQSARAAYDAEGQRLMDRYNLALNEANTAYAQGRDALGDIRYDQEYADKIAYQDWQKQQAELDRQEQQKQWDYKVSQESKSQAYEMAMQMISTGQTPSNDLLAQAGISADYARAMAAYYKKQAALSGSSGGGRSSGGGGSRRYSSGGRSGSPAAKNDDDYEPETGPKYTREESNAAYAVIKHQIIMSNMSGDLNFATSAFDKYSDRLTEDQAAELMALFDQVQADIDKRKQKSGGGKTGSGRSGKGTKDRDSRLN